MPLNSRTAKPCVPKQCSYKAAVQVGLEVAAVSKGGLRGTTAARDFQKGDVVASLPRKCTILVGLSTMTAPVWVCSAHTSTIGVALHYNVTEPQFSSATSQHALHAMLLTGAGSGAAEDAPRGAGGVGLLCALLGQPARAGRRELQVRVQGGACTSPAGCRHGERLCWPAPTCARHLSIMPAWAEPSWSMPPAWPCHIIYYALASLLTVLVGNSLSHACLTDIGVFRNQAEFMEYMREHLREVFERSGDEGGMADLAVPLEEFEHYTALVLPPSAPLSC